MIHLSCQVVWVSLQHALCSGKDRHKHRERSGSKDEESSIQIQHSEVKHAIEETTAIGIRAATATTATPWGVKHALEETTATVIFRAATAAANQQQVQQHQQQRQRTCASVRPCRFHLILA